MSERSSHVTQHVILGLMLGIAIVGTALGLLARRWLATPAQADRKPSDAEEPS